MLSEKSQLMKWITLSFLTIIFLYTPFKRGLFFSQDIYIYVVMLTFAFIFWVIIFSFKKNMTFSNKYLALFLLPFIYYFTFFVAESSNKNFESLFSWLAYISFFCLLLWVRSEKRVEALLPHIFNFLGTLIAFFAIFGLWEWVSYQDVVLGDRTTGPFQYANTFAAVIGASWIFSLVYLTRQRINWFGVVLFSIPLVAYGVGFLHAYSRGALIVFPLAWLIGLCCLRTREQVLYLLFSCVSFVGSFLAFRVMVDQEKIPDQSSPGLGVFILCVILVVGLVCLIQYISRTDRIEKKMSSLQHMHYWRLILPCIALIIGIGLWLDIVNKGLVYSQLPTTFQERLASINISASSVLGRTNMFADAWLMSKDAPFLGSGGGGWKILYSSYQTTPYLSNEIHNGYLEVLLNTGWLGFILFTGVFLFLFMQIVYRIWLERTNENQPVYIGAIAALLMLFIHAAIDFDFSYGTVWFIIFWLFAMSVPFEPIIPLWGKFTFIQWNRGKMKVVGRAAMTFLLLGVLIGGIYSYRFYVASDVNAAATSSKSLTFNEGLHSFERATSYNPYNSDYWISLAQVVLARYNNSPTESDRSQIIEYLGKAEKMEEHNSINLYKIANGYAGLNDWEKAVSYMSKSIDNDPFNVNWYKLILAYKFQWSQQVKINGNTDLSDEILLGLVQDYEAYLKWYNEWKDQTLPDRRAINIDKQSHYIAADAYMLLEQYNQSLSIWKTLGAAIDRGMYDESGKVLLNKPFEVQSLSQFISNYLDYTIVLSVKDEAAYMLTAESKDLLEQLGSKISELEYRGSYVAIIQDGNVVYDLVRNNDKIEISDENTPELQSVFKNKPYSIYSAGNKLGNRSSIRIDGVEYSKDQRGMNIAVFDDNLNIIKAFHFDTFLSDISIKPLN